MVPPYSVNSHKKSFLIEEDNENRIKINVLNLSFFIKLFSLRFPLVSIEVRVNHGYCMRWFLIARVACRYHIPFEFRNFVILLIYLRHLFRSDEHYFLRNTLQRRCFTVLMRFSMSSSYLFRSQEPCFVFAKN